MNGGRAGVTDALTAEWDCSSSPSGEARAGTPRAALPLAHLIRMFGDEALCLTADCVDSTEVLLTLGAEIYGETYAEAPPTHTLSY